MFWLKSAHSKLGTSWDRGTVKFSITAFSRPSSLLARTGGSITRAPQSWITGRYLGAI
ncbi:DUF1990 family protein [Tessaracoccus antarcticus]|uniref:DUF1990 family protein n=1 Tax=Tessaracoccus antarcticus TaxID=2479848 RepID=A0A3M0GBJ9_9ACTN|nr:DUF1990 family protein [Tessaracoccus antarcticus]